MDIFHFSESLSVESVSVSSLKPNPKNPRIHSKKQIEQIAKSIKAFGFNVPVLVDGKNQVIAGHGRVLACEQLGIKEVPVIRLEHLTDAQATAFMIADNKLTENAAWDEALLKIHFEELSAINLDFELDATGFEVAEIDLMLQSAPQESDPADDIPETANGLPVTRQGDMWHLGKHRLYCGSSLEAGTFKQVMNGDLATVVFIDPPYNVPVDGHVCGLGEVKHREFAMASGEMTEGEFTAFLIKSFSLLKNYSKDGSIHFICMDWRHGYEIITAGRTVYNELKNLCVWCKDNAGMGTFYRSQHELVYVFKNGTAPHLNNFELGQHGRYRTNVWKYAGVNSFARHSSEEGNLLALHPTVKPVQMVADALMDCSKRGDIVLDAFLGSGTTLIAAERTGRVCCGIEIDPAYVDTAIRRWQKLTGLDAGSPKTGKTFNEIENSKEKNRD